MSACRVAFYATSSYWQQVLFASDELAVCKMTSSSGREFLRL